MDCLDRLHDLLDREIPVVLGTVGADGFPAGRAMLPPRRREGLRIWYFSTNTSSRKVAELSANPKCGVYVFDALSFEGALFQGKVEVLRDAVLRRDLWRHGDEAFYPGGVNDDDYSVLRFTAYRVRWYGGNLPCRDFSLLADDYFSSRALLLRMSER